MNQQNQPQEKQGDGEEPFDYTHVNSVARIALYDDLLSAPHVTEIQPAPTAEFIENLATNVYQQSQQAGGTIPYTVIREVSENFIHARFQEATVSILDHGCTIRFADQGPGIACKERAQLPGFTSAIEPMKSYIRGVGSGLPIVKEYLDFTHGTISIEDNLGTGSVVTISANGSNPKLPKELEIDNAEEAEDEQAPRPRYLIASEEGQTPRYAPQQQVPQAAAAYAAQYAPQVPAQSVVQPTGQYAQVQPYAQQAGYAPQQGLISQQGFAPQQGYATGMQPAYATGAMPSVIPYQQQAPTFPTTPGIGGLSQRERDFINMFMNEGALKVPDIVNLTGMAQSSVYNTLNKLEEAGILEKTKDKRRALTQLGMQIAQQL